MESEDFIWKQFKYDDTEEVWLLNQGERIVARVWKVASGWRWNALRGFRVSSGAASTAEIAMGLAKSLVDACESQTHNN